MSNAGQTLFLIGEVYKRSRENLGYTFYPQIRGKDLYGKIVEQGKRWLRWAAVEAVWPSLKADFEAVFLFNS